MSTDKTAMRMQERARGLGWDAAAVAGCDFVTVTDEDQKTRMRQEFLGEKQVPATWEGSVLPALREALDEYTETRGCRFARVGPDKPGSVTALIFTSHGGRSGDIRLASHEAMREDCAALATAAVKVDQAGRALAAMATACPVCAALPGWLCSTCRVEAAGSVAVPDLPPSARLDQDDADGVRMVAEAMGLPASALVDERTGRTPLPERWTWDDVQRCGADGPDDEWVLLEVIGSYTGRFITSGKGPAPTAVHNALVREARRLGLVCHEVERVEVSAPEGYTFREDPSGVVVRPSNVCMPNGEAVQYYWRRDCTQAYMNANQHRWRGHEAARQWAAHLLGETAPPLDASPEPWTPKVGDRVRLPDLDDARKYRGFSKTIMAPLCGLVGEVMAVSERRAAYVNVKDKGQWWWGIDGMRPA